MPAGGVGGSSIRGGWYVSAPASRLHASGFDIADAKHPEVENAGGQHGVGTGVDRRHEIRDASGSATGDERYVDDGPHRAGPISMVVAGRGAVGVHRVQQDLAGAERGAAFGPLDGVDPGPAPSTVRGHLKTAGGALERRPGYAGIDGQHDALVAEALRTFGDELRAGDGRGVDPPCRPPTRSNRSTSSGLRTPPPTVNGMKTCSAGLPDRPRTCSPGCRCWP